MKSILNKGTFVLFLIFIISTILMVNDPLGLNPLGIDGETAKPALYFIPAVIFWFFYFVYPTVFRKKGIQEDIQNYAAKIASTLKVLLSVLATLIMVDANFNLGIPLLDVIFDFARYLADNLDTSVAAIGTIISFILGAKAIVFKEDVVALYIQKSFSKPQGRKYE